MTPRPVHRWKSFWLGVVVLVFLGWAWVHSTTNYNGVKVEIGGSMTTAVFNQYRSSVSLFLRRDGPPASTDMSWIHGKFSEGSPPSNGFMYRSWSSAGRVPVTMEIVIAYWLIMALFLAIWATSLLARWCRMRARPKVAGPAHGGGI